MDNKGEQAPAAFPRIVAMRKTRTLAIALLLMAHALPALSLSVGLDAAGAFSPLWGSGQAGGEVSARVGDRLRIAAGVGWYGTLDSAHDVNYVNVSLAADCFLFPGWGAYAGISLLDCFAPFGVDASGGAVFSSHLRAGWAFDLPWFTIDLRLALRDVSLSGGSSGLDGAIAQLGAVSPSITFSFRWDVAADSDSGQGGEEQ